MSNIPATRPPLTNVVPSAVPSGSFYPPPISRVEDTGLKSALAARPGFKGNVFPGVPDRF